jgi:hypothetical protein
VVNDLVAAQFATNDSFHDDSMFMVAEILAISLDASSTIALRRTDFLSTSPPEFSVAFWVVVLL